MRRRVKITGIGPVTPAGIGRENFWSGIIEPVSRVRRYSELGDEFGPFVAAYIENFDVGKFVSRDRIQKGASRQSLFAIAGAILALQDAGIRQEELASSNCAIVVGSSIVDFGSVISSMDAVARHGAHRAKPRTLYTFHPAVIPGGIGDVLGISARTMNVQTSCCASMDAIGHAARMVASGEADLALCGGTEAPLHRFPLPELRAAGLTPATDSLPDAVARPFDLWRTVGVVGEGACMFVIEPESSPRKGYSYITGYAFANDDPESVCSGIVTADKMALAAAGLRPKQVEVMVTWGPGHREIDAAEAQSILTVFGDSVSDIAAVSVKGALAVSLGSAPSVDVGVAALSQRNRLIPPTVNWQHPDPQCPLNLSAGARAISHEVTLVHSHGVGGLNSSLILERC